MDGEKQHKKKCQCCTAKVTIGVLIPVGIILVITGGMFPTIYKYVVEKQLVLKKGTTAYNNWYSPPSPVYMEYFVFNYTNVQDILLNHVKPNVTQLGPYTYREIRKNKILDLNDYNITYLQNYSYVFDQSMSCPTCTEENMIYAPSIVAMTLIKAIQDKLNATTQPYVVTVLDKFISGVPQFTLFKKLTVCQLLWGYTDELMKLVKDLENILKYIGFKLPPVSTKVALQSNGTEEANAIGNITILTGKENIKDVQRIVRWRGLHDAPYWLTKYGMMINGTDGTHAPPFLSRDFKFYVFITELCRSLYLKYEKDETYQDIQLYKFSTTPELFINSTINPDNGAFCSSKTRCWGSGLLPISQCRGGAPIFMSAPHFYQGDPKFAEAINGMHPNGSIHSTIIDVEPNTGIPMIAHKRLQINVLAEKSFLTIVKPLQNKYNFLPVIYVNEGAVIDRKTADKFKKEVLLLKTIMTYGEYILIGIGSATFLLAMILAVKKISGQYDYKLFVDERKDAVDSIDQPS